MKLPIELSAHLTPEPNSGCWLWTRSLTAEVARLQALLKEIEWGGWDELLGAVCPSCENWKEKGHTPDCALRAALVPPPMIEYVLTVNPNTPVEVERGKCGKCGHEPHQGRECFAIKVTPDEKWDGLCKCGTGREGTNG